MRLNLYIQKNINSDEYEIFKTDYVLYDTSVLNIENMRMFLINYFKGEFDNTEYKIKILKEGNKTVVNVFFNYETYIKRDLQINKILHD